MSKKTDMPVHIGIILDGNRRWAKERGLPTFQGHKKGAENLKKILDHARERGIKIISVYAFSTENWKRSKKEVQYLMGIFFEFISKYINEMKEKGIRFAFMGDLSALPPRLQKKMKQATEETKNNTDFVFNMGINYGGRDDVLRAFKRVIEKGYRAKDLSIDLISQNLDTAGLPDPDLIIRTSGEQRLSGFMMWQSVYSELYFTNIYWPDFNEKEFDKAIEEYESRQRRFGN